MATAVTRKRAYLIGLGMAIFPIHNAWLAKVTSINGEAILFLPVFGSIIIILATLFYLRDHYKELDWGDKRVYIPLLVIVAAISTSGLTSCLMGVSLFALYLVSRNLGKDMFKPLAIGAVIASIGVLISGIINPGKLTGGLVFENNYDIVVGYVLLGAVLFINRYQWLLIGLALAAMLVSKSPEGLFAVGVMSLVVLLRRDWGKKLVLIIAPAIIVLVLFAGSGLFSYAKQIINFETTMSISGEEPRSAIGYRLWVIEEAMTNLNPLGTGYNLTAFFKDIVHNVPLIIVQQLGIPGILAAIAWVWVTIWCLVKTKWKYAFALILTLSVWDHYVWTQLAPYWWALTGVATASNIKSDLIFKE